MKKHDYIIIFAIILYVAENIYFGMNLTAQSVAEKIADSVVTALMVYGFATMFLDHLRPTVNITLNGFKGEMQDS